MKLILIGIISGIVTGLGMGGGSILILFLTMFMDITQHTAQAAKIILICFLHPFQGLLLFQKLSQLKLISYYILPLIFLFYYFIIIFIDAHIKNISNINER